MNTLWQSMPSSAFKTGLYAGYLSLGEVRAHGNFGVGEYEYLDGEVTALDGDFYRQTAEGKLLPIGDDERLCFASVAPFHPTESLDLECGLSESSIRQVFLQAFGTSNGVFAMRVDGVFSKVATTVVPRQSKPFTTFDKVPHTEFHFADIAGTLVCFYSPAYLSLTGIPGFHFHFLAEDRSGGGHVTGFTLSEGRARWCRLGGFSLSVPCDPDFDNAPIK